MVRSAPSILVMELVRGIRITEYCDQADPTTVIKTHIYDHRPVKKNPGAVWIRTIIFRAGSGSAATKSHLNFISHDPDNLALKEHLPC